MRVLHVVDRVVVAGPGPQVEIEVDRRVGRVAGQRVPGGVDPDRVDHVVERDRRAGPLAHPYRLPVPDQVHQLSDEDLEVAVGVVTEAGGHGPHAADVPVVVGAEHDHDPVEAALPLVQVVRAVGGEVGPVAVAA